MRGFFVIRPNQAGIAVAVIAAKSENFLKLGEIRRRTVADERLPTAVLLPTSGCRDCRQSQKLVLLGRSRLP
jgi:hypothetical protein